MLRRIILPLIFLIFSVSTVFGASKPEQRTFRISKNMTIFNSVLRELDLFYVDTLNYDKMVKGSINQMLEKLDPYTVYLPEEETDDLTFMTTGEYAGIGAMIMKTGNDVCVSEPYEGMPAQRNGIRAGDILQEIDGQKVTGKSVNDVSAMLKGTPGTTIKLKLKRPGEKNIIEKSFVREKIQINPLKYSALVGDKVGYVLLSEFTDRAAIELKTAVNELVRKNQIESLVLDIRNNGGGLIDEAIKIVDLFLSTTFEGGRHQTRVDKISKNYC